MATKKATTTTVATVRVVKRWRRSERPTEGWWPWGLLPLLGFAALMFFSGLYFARAHIEDDVAKESRDRLGHLGYGWALVDVDGRQVNVHGTAPEPVSEDAIVALVETTQCRTLFGRFECPTSVSIDIDTEPPPIPVARGHAFELTRRDGRVILKGEVPSPSERDRLLAMARENFSSVDNELTVSNNLATENFPRAVDSASSIMRLLASGRVTWRGGRLGVNGIARAGQKTQLEAVLAEWAPEHLAEVAVLKNEDAAACDDDFSRQLAKSKIRFATGSAVIEKASSIVLLEEIAAIARRCAVTLQVEGHTDNVGEPDDNRALSLRRAASVVDALARLGIDRERLVPLGFGERRPLADNDTLAGQAQNRRIEIRIRR